MPSSEYWRSSSVDRTQDQIVDEQRSGESASAGSETAGLAADKERLESDLRHLMAEVARLRDDADPVVPASDRSRPWLVSRSPRIAPGTGRAAPPWLASRRTRG